MTSDRDVGEELLRRAAGAKPPPDPVTTVEAVSRRQRRRVRLWAALTVALWILAAGYSAANVLVYLIFFYPKLASLIQDPSADGRGTAAREFLHIQAYYLLYSNVLWPVLLVAAAGMTVLFVLKSRQATMRQIQASLDDISRRIEAPPRRPPDAGEPAGTDPGR